MIKKRNLLLTLAVAWLLLGASLGHTVPQLINYQGRLVDSGGSPVTGTKSIAFTIYDAATGGSILWQETQSIQITDGLFNVLLGSINPIDDSVFNGDSRFLGIKVESDPEGSPRHQLVSVGYAFTADNLGGGAVNVDATGNVGIGTTGPSEKLDVAGGVKIENTTTTNAGTIRWTGTDFEGYDGTTWKSLTAGAGGSHFGDWETKSPSTTYQAETDGIACAWLQRTANGIWAWVLGYTGSTPTSLVRRAGNKFEGNNADASITFPVKKGEYWRVIFDSNYSLNKEVYWRPIH